MIKGISKVEEIVPQYPIVEHSKRIICRNLIRFYFN